MKIKYSIRDNPGLWKVGDIIQVSTPYDDIDRKQLINNKLSLGDECRITTIFLKHLHIDRASCILRVESFKKVL